MGWITDLLSTLAVAGPWAGWVIAGFGLLGTVWLYATDRLISHGRHVEQAAHYKHRMEDLESSHRQQIDQLRASMQALIEQEQFRVQSYLTERDYWRDGLLDLLSVTAEALGREPLALPDQEGGSA